MRIKVAAAIPVPDEDAKLRPKDFSSILGVVPPDCVLIGGQAVAWWAERYGIEATVKGKKQAVTSRDIDFWGTREDLFERMRNKGLHAKPEDREKLDKFLAIQWPRITAAEQNRRTDL